MIKSDNKPPVEPSAEGKPSPLENETADPWKADDKQKSHGASATKPSGDSWRPELAETDTQGQAGRLDVSEKSAEADAADGDVPSDVDLAFDQNDDEQAIPIAPSPRPVVTAEKIPAGKTSRKKRRADKQNAKRASRVGIIGFSASGKTVFLSMLYHATSETLKFGNGWHAEWGLNPGDETVRYLRQMAGMILGRDAKGATVYKDPARTRVQRTFPPGTKSVSELTLMLTRTWGLLEYPVRLHTLEFSGEAIHRAAYLGPHRLDAHERSQWEQVLELCRSSDALLLFLNLLNVDLIHDSGEMRILLESALRDRERSVRSVAIVVTGADTIKDQAEIDHRMQMIEKKYAAVLDTLDNRRIRYRFFMVSSVGWNMVRKRTSGLDISCQGSDHLCPLCQELVDDVDAEPQPLGMEGPLEFVFRSLLPVRLHWEPLASVFGALTRLRIALLNRYAIMAFLAVGTGLGAFWYHRKEAELLESHAYRLERLASERAIHAVVETVNDYKRWFGWLRPERVQRMEDSVRSAREFIDLLEHVAVADIAASDKLASLVAFMDRHPQFSVFIDQTMIAELSLASDFESILAEEDPVARLAHAGKLVSNWVGEPIQQHAEARFVDLLTATEENMLAVLRNLIILRDMDLMVSTHDQIVAQASVLREWPNLEYLPDYHQALKKVLSRMDVAASRLKDRVDAYVAAQQLKRTEETIQQALDYMQELDYASAESVLRELGEDVSEEKEEVVSTLMQSAELGVRAQGLLRAREIDQARALAEKLQDTPDPEVRSSAAALLDVIAEELASREIRELRHAIEVPWQAYIHSFDEATKDAARLLRHSRTDWIRIETETSRLRNSYSEWTQATVGPAQMETARKAFAEMESSLQVLQRNLTTLLQRADEEEAREKMHAARRTAYESKVQSFDRELDQFRRDRSSRDAGEIAKFGGALNRQIDDALNLAVAKHREAISAANRNAWADAEKMIDEGRDILRDARQLFGELSKTIERNLSAYQAAWISFNDAEKSVKEKVEGMRRRYARHLRANRSEWNSISADVENISSKAASLRNKTNVRSEDSMRELEVLTGDLQGVERRMVLLERRIQNAMGSPF